MEQIVIVGGGMGGLLAAAELKRRGASPIVLEANPRPGGVARSIEKHGYRLEPAAGTLLLPHPALSPILEDASVVVAPVASEGTRRWVYTRQRLIEAKAGPGLAVSPLVSWGGKARAVLEPWIRPSEIEDESLDSFLCRRFGKGVGSLAAHLMASGVHAADPRRLSKHAFEGLPVLESDYGSIVRGGFKGLKERPRGARPAMHVPLGGMSGLADALGYFLGDAIHCSFEVGDLHHGSDGWVIEGPERIKASRVILAVAPDMAARLTGGELGDLLRLAEAAPVAVIGLGGPASDFALPDGFGYLTGPDANMVGVGCLFESVTDPTRAPAGHSLVKVIAGGGLNPHVVDWDDPTLVTRVGEEVAQVLGRHVTASFTEVVRHRPGIPQQTVGHRAWLSRLAAALAGRDGLHLAGWAYRGVGLSHLATDARRLADVILGSR